MSEEKLLTEEELEVQEQDEILNFLDIEPEEEEQNEHVDEAEEEVDDVGNEDDPEDDVIEGEDDPAEGEAGDDPEEEEIVEDVPEGEPEEVEQTDAELLEERIKKLTEIIEQQSIAKLDGKPPEPETPAAKPTEVETPKTLAEIIGSVDFNEYQDDNSKFVEMIAKVVEFTKLETAKTLQQDLGNTVQSQTITTMNLQTMVDNFYRDHSELSEVKQTVSAVAKNIGVEHPDWGMEKVLEEAATTTRNMLGLTKPKTTKQAKPTRNGRQPATPRTAGGKRGAKAKKLTEQQKQINDLID